MYLAIEYLVRKGIVKDWFKVPCSLFLTEPFGKKVVTINEEFKPSTFYCVKHWHLYACQRDQAIPSFTEFRVPKTEVFTHQAVIVPNHSLMQFLVAPIPFNENGYSHPMMDDLYQFFYNNYIESYRHKENKVNWLWREFMYVYMPHLLDKPSHLIMYKSENEVAADQRKFIATQYIDLWHHWSKWCKYMLYIEEGSIPSELIFMKEYKNTNSKKLVIC